ncbi:hypothetical protein [Phyllobacterium zundukense]|jgi:hypothetical protein|uniref:Uncharacterized protein n=1 Tax=Phyllobacterium zundukense TaxID=1867719 RepID=A0ACD4D5J1_9HYPH|nr:hypothetical protein [Phyllobacterium zundukense]UXN61067.1 hypothetical protein N8E88_13270 [Phyllobacterium zundukense]
MDLNGRITVFGALVASLALGGCMSSPTYGTDKTAGSQLLDDVSNMASFGSSKKKNQIAYNPRPELVRPAEGKVAQLPAPQNDVVTTDSANWPESPEARRKRIRDTATANQNNPNFVPEVENDMPLAQQSAGKPEYGFFNDKSPANQGSKSTAGADFRARKLASTAGSPTTRRYLSEPPLEYRAPASTAAANELGEDEAKKERERKAAAKKDKGFSWKNLIPWE